MKLKLTNYYLKLFILFFFISGYYFSDNRYALYLIHSNRLTQASDAFDYVINKKIQAPAGSIITNGQSFRRMMSEERTWLWCDEGAISIAVLARQLGYETRLVDLLNPRTKSSYHTVVEVKVNEIWRVFDFTGRKILDDPKKSIEFISETRYRTYPDYHHILLLNNFYLRRISEFWQSI